MNRQNVQLYLPVEEQDSGIQLDSIVEQNTTPKSSDVRIVEIPDKNIDPAMLNC
jgi:hypothetical protein